MSFELNWIQWIAGEVYSNDYRFTIVEMQYLGDLAKLVYFKSSVNVMESLFMLLFMLSYDYTWFKTEKLHPNLILWHFCIQYAESVQGIDLNDIR